jgi:hypothetical protein
MVDTVYVRKQYIKQYGTVVFVLGFVSVMLMDMYLYG